MHPLVQRFALEGDMAGAKTDPLSMSTINAFNIVYEGPDADGERRCGPGETAAVRNDAAHLAIVGAGQLALHINDDMTQNQSIFKARAIRLWNLLPKDVLGPVFGLLKHSQLRAPGVAPGAPARL